MIVLLMLVMGLVGVNPANILMYIPASSRSHVTAWEPLARGLARSGHHLTFVSSYQLQPEVNFTQILVKSEALKEIDEDFRSILLASDSVLGHIWKLLRMIYLFPDRMAEIHDEALTEMKTVLDKKWDLVIANPFLNEVGIILGDHFQVPTIHFLPANAEQFLSFSLGHPDNPAWSHPSADSLVSRSVVLLINFLYGLAIKPISFKPQLAVAAKHLRNFSLSENQYWRLERNADFSFYFSSTFLSNHNPRLPNSMQVGFIHCREGEELSPNIQKFLAGKNKNAVLMSLGSIIQTEDFPDDFIGIFEKVFIKLGIKVIWKTNRKVESKNILTGNWFSQQDILAHENIGLFISQCGMMSMQEAIYHQVPILCLPITFEQITNSKMIIQKKLGISLQLQSLTASSLETAILDVLNTPLYSENMKQLITLIKDRPTPLLEESLFWVDHVIRNNGANHLKSRNRYLSMVEFYHLDIIGVILIGSTISFLFFCVFLHLLIKGKLWKFIFFPGTPAVIVKFLKTWGITKEHCKTT